MIRIVGRSSIDNLACVIQKLIRPSPSTSLSAKSHPSAYLFSFSASALSYKSVSTPAR